jgi:hypothetical protein
VKLNAFVRFYILSFLGLAWLGFFIPALSYSLNGSTDFDI